MKFCLILTTALMITSFLTACGAPQPTGEDYAIRSATPGVVDHNVIPKRSKAKH